MSQTRYLKSMITPTLVEPTENHEAGVASGVWSTQDQLEARRGGVWPEAGVTDPNTLIENNFSTFLYTGNATARTITNNINLSGKGGLVWTKKRNDTVPNTLVDTERGTGKYLEANGTGQEQTGTNNVTGFTSTGYTIGATAGAFNDNNDTYVSWTWKKAPKFFDVVTYTGNDTSGRTIAHSLGTAVGMIAVKNLSRASDWAVFHRSSNAAPQDYVLEFQNANAATSSSSRWNDTAPTSSVFTVGDYVSVNQNGDSYVAYLWAHETGDDSMIQCGSIAGNGNDSREIDLGWEPQFVMFKRTDSSSGGSWFVYDNMRGLVVGGADPYLRWDTTAAEASDQNYLEPTPIGFKIGAKGDDDGAYFNQSGRSYIYMAIRRPNMATITDATEVFDITLTSQDTSLVQTDLSVIDWNMHLKRAGDQSSLSTRMLGNLNRLNTTRTNAEAAYGSAPGRGNFDTMGKIQAFTSNNQVCYSFTRAKGFFDVVAYTGAGSARTVAHGLGVVPEMIWIKRRSGTESWAVYYGDNTDYLVLNTDAGTADNVDRWNDTSPTASVFTVGDANEVAGNGDTYIAYLFATLAGVSKVGSVTHSGSSTDVDCGFSAGAKLVMLKRTDATGDWYTWDVDRGIIAGNDPYLLLNSTAAEVTNTDYIDPLASGFQISGDFTDGDYLFYAIA